MSGADLRLDEPGALMGHRFDGTDFAHACHTRSVAVDNNPAILRRQVAQAEKLLAIGDRPAAQALALELKQCVQAIPRASPAQSFSNPRAQADVEASGS